MEYLVLGAFLFEQPLSDDKKFDALRNRFNDVARARLSSLYQLLTSLPNVSPQVRKMLQRHRERFDRPW